ncbi:unnamed protein product [Nyctereutes procyonoides]|uniref:(raccoon dog) hypothetical protein n=1 Tax=Nyctereutes procyonoides TaxID=34880 RepID=A0A811YXW5_NYCPR|nr:unnamed protein product [Nyctereutes procyonoides]
MRDTQRERERERESLAQLENLCKWLYETIDTTIRLQAEKALDEFTDSPDCLSKCQLLLERGSSSYSQLLAATCLTISCITHKQPSTIGATHRYSELNCVFNYLATRPKLATFVTQALTQLYARITKLGWFDCQKDDYDSGEYGIIGVTILSQLTNEINQADTTHPLTKHRKIASSFRDSSLFDIFTLSCNLLKQASGKNLNLNDESQHGLLMQLLKLTHNCLNFDFIGTSTDESSDDLCTVPIPTSWRSAFLDSSTLQLFFDLYRCIPPSFSPLSLSDPNNYHEFCRLLARLKSSYQLGELHWEFALNSVHYLLSLWQWLAASGPYVKATEPHMLETYTPEVTRVYYHIPFGIYPLEDTGLGQQQLDQLSTIERCEYEKTCTLLVQLFDQSAQLTWLDYIIDAVISGQVFFASTDEQDAMDGELVCRVLRLMNLTDSHLAQAGNEKLELAMLSFFEQFCKIYIGDQVQKSSKLYCQLSEVLGLNDETMWDCCEPITSKTLQLFSDLSIEYSSVRKLVKLSAVRFMLNNHTYFSFLANSSGLIRDLRRIAFSFNAETSFMILFEWIYPSYMPILRWAIELWYHDPACTAPVLKLMAELVHNISHKMITLYGNRILTLGGSQRIRSIALKLKGISNCFFMLKAALSGSYVNFGVFCLYGDDVLDNALQNFIEPLLSIPHSDLLDHPKLIQSYYSLLEVLTQGHMNFIASLELDVIMYILSSVSEGLTALDTIVCTGCCSCLDHIVTYLFKQLSWSTKKRMTPLNQENGRFLHIMQQHPETIQQMLSMVLNIIFEDCRNQWSTSRPLLGLILLNEKFFSDLRNSIVNSQPPEKQQAMHLCFENLMEGIEFTQNLSAFHREVNGSMKNSTYGVKSNDMMS